MAAASPAADARAAGTDVRIHPRGLSLITTKRCTAACDHCCFHCTPRATDAIPVERLHALIEEAREVPSIRLIVFTGGECFLLGRELDALVARASAHGFATRCITNGYWASSLRVALRRMRALAAAGLTEIEFSTGPFHAAYIPPRRVVLGAVAAARAGLRTTINIEVSAGSPFDAGVVTADPLLLPFLGLGQVRVAPQLWIENGGRAAVRHLPTLSRLGPGRMTGCGMVLDLLSVTPDLRLMACCGFHMDRIETMRIASLRDQTLAEALSAAPEDGMKAWLHVEGPERILRTLQRRDPDITLPENPVHPCESCLHLHRQPRALDAMRETWPEVAGRILPAFRSGPPGADPVAPTPPPPPPPASRR